MSTKPDAHPALFREIRSGPERVMFRLPSLKAAGSILVGLAVILAIAWFLRRALGSGWIGGCITLCVGAAVVLGVVGSLPYLFGQELLIIEPNLRRLRVLSRTVFGRKERTAGFDLVDCVRLYEKGKEDNHVWIDLHEDGEGISLGEAEVAPARRLAARVAEILGVPVRGKGSSLAGETRPPCPRCGFGYAFDGEHCTHCNRNA